MLYAKIPEEKRTKFDSKANVALLVSYSEASKGYKLYNMEAKKILISRDVKFDERQYWNWEKGAVESLRKVTISDKDLSQFNNDEDLDIEDESKAIRGTRSLEDIYSRCNVAILELISFMEAVLDSKWKDAMDAKMSMIT